MTVLELLQESREIVTLSGWIGPAGEANPFVKHPKHVTIAVAIFRARELTPDPDDALLLAAWGELERAATPLAWHQDRFMEETRGREPTTEDLKRFQALFSSPAQSILDWLAAPDRNVFEVLTAFNKAINRLKGEQRNG